MYTTFRSRTAHRLSWLAVTLTLSACGQADRNTSAPGSDSQADAAAQAPAGWAAAEATLGRPSARATLESIGDSGAQGAVLFVETGDGLHIAARVSGLEPGPHGMHLHENGDCSGAGAEAAGDHFAPRGHPHGSPSDTPAEHHAGDLGNIRAPFGGTADKRMTDQGLTLHGNLGVVGRAVVVHEGEDDLSSQPSGGSGNPIACGVVRMAGAPALGQAGRTDAIASPSARAAQ